MWTAIYQYLDSSVCHIGAACLDMTHRWDPRLNIHQSIQVSVLNATTCFFLLCNKTLKMDKRVSFVGSVLEPPTKLFASYIMDIMVKVFSKKEKLSHTNALNSNDYLNIVLALKFCPPSAFYLPPAAAFTF